MFCRCSIFTFLLYNNNNERDNSTLACFIININGSKNKFYCACSLDFQKKQSLCSPTQFSLSASPQVVPIPTSFKDLGLKTTEFLAALWKVDGEARLRSMPLVQLVQRKAGTVLLLCLPERHQVISDTHKLQTTQSGVGKGQGRVVGNGSSNSTGKDFC